MLYFIFKAHYQGEQPEDSSGSLTKERVGMGGGDNGGNASAFSSVSGENKRGRRVYHSLLAPCCQTTAMLGDGGGFLLLPNSPGV